MCEGENYTETPLPAHLENKVVKDSCVNPSERNRLPDNSVHLMVTSPPYAVGKDYDDDLSLDEYFALLYSAWKETKRVLVPGGRVCINIANIGRKPYIPLHAYIIHQMLDLDFLMRGTIIWNKGSSAGNSTAWGSWRSASNPCLRDEHEYILVFSKGVRDSTIKDTDFMSNTRSVWNINTESAKRIGHPAPFPVELPKRCIELCTNANDVIYDPFMGSGTTGVAAVNTGRRFVGYEINADYANLAMRRILVESLITPGRADSNTKHA